MVPVAGKPIVDRQLEWLRAGGVTDVVLLCGYKADVLEAHVGDGSRFGVRVQYSLEERAAGPRRRAEAGLRACAAIVRSDVVACNSDILTDQPLGRVIAFHIARRPPSRPSCSRRCRAPTASSMSTEDGRIESFREKPVLPYWVNAGIYVLLARVLRAAAGQGRPRDDDVPGAGGSKAGCSGSRAALTGARWTRSRTCRRRRRSSRARANHPPSRRRRAVVPGPLLGRRGGSIQRRPHRLSGGVDHLADHSPMTLGSPFRRTSYEPPGDVTKRRMSLEKRWIAGLDDASTVA